MSREGARVARPAHRPTMLSTRSAAGHAPSFAIATDAGRLGADPQLGPGPSGLQGERRLEARAVEDVTYVTFRDPDLGAVGGPEDHAGDAARDPARAGGIEEL